MGAIEMLAARGTLNLRKNAGFRGLGFDAETSPV